MGFLDDFFDCKICDTKDTRIKYTPDLLSGTRDIVKSTKGIIKGTKEVANKTKECVNKCGSFAYTMTADWCSVLKGTDFHIKCMELIFDGLDDGIGVPVEYYLNTLCITFPDYWYEAKNLKLYTNSQLKKVEKELNKGKDSLDLCIDMLNYTWNSITHGSHSEEIIDELFVYKIRVKYIKR